MRNVEFAALVGLPMLLVLSLAASQDGTRIHPIERLTVVDANGKRVGPVVDLSSPFGLQSVGVSASPTVALDVEGQLVVLAVTRNRFAGPVNIVYFESTDCSGTPFFNGTEAGISVAEEPTQGLAPAAAALSDGTIYALDPDNPLVVHNFTAQSSKNSVASPPSCDQAGGQVLDAVRARMVVNLGERFEPPFRLRWAREREGNN